MVDAGIMLGGEGSSRVPQGKRVAFDGASRMVIDGPFAETKEMVAGYWIWKCGDMDEAIAWVKRCPNPMRARAKSRSGPFTNSATSLRS